MLILNLLTESKGSCSSGVIFCNC